MDCVVRSVAVELIQVLLKTFLEINLHRPRAIAALNLILNFIYDSGTSTCSWNQMWEDYGISYKTDFPITVNEIGTITCSNGTEIQLNCTGSDEFDKDPVTECDSGIVELVLGLWD